MFYRPVQSESTIQHAHAPEYIANHWIYLQNKLFCGSEFISQKHKDRHAQNKDSHNIISSKAHDHVAFALLLPLLMILLFVIHCIQI